MKPVIFLLFLILGCSKNIETPLSKKQFNSFTTSQELREYIHSADKRTDIISIIDSTNTVGGNYVYLLKIEIPNNRENKLRVFIFAQQHGNEHSGKEASLRLLNKIVNKEFGYDLANLVIYLIPQVNPDGSDIDQRRNSNNIDLNRDHLILTQNETLFIRETFNKYLPHAVLDVHEYFPFSKNWMDFGYIKYFDVQFGSLTNPNIPEELLKLSEEEFFPFIEEFLNDKNVTHHKYLVGGPPNLKRIRYSTTDINDGRQSTGIHNTFSFILEGRNGKTSSENLEERTANQYKAISGWISFLNENHHRVLEAVQNSRNKFRDAYKDSVAIRQDHFPLTGEKRLILKDINNNRDTVITFQNFHPIVKPLLNVSRPKGYLINKKDSVLIDWLERNYIKYRSPQGINTKNIIEYRILNRVKSIDEELENCFAKVKATVPPAYSSDNYLFVPADNEKANYIIIALEPQSQFGLVQYEMFAYLLKKKSYPILKVNFQ